MRTRAIFLILTIWLIAFLGCQDLAVKENITGNYYLVAADEIEGTALSYHVNEVDGPNYSSLIESAVFGVGYNDRYMIVEQHPRTFPNSPNKKIINYYILPLKEGMDWKSKNGLIGPLSLQQFKDERKVLNIPENLTFTKEMDYIK